MPEAVLTALGRAREQGFLGEGDLEVQLRHAFGFAEAAAAAGLPTGPVTLLDLGSGGGVPGLVLAAAWPTCQVTLLDANVRRCAFLREAVAACGWEGRAVVVEARAEEAARQPTLRHGLQLVVARSFGPPAVVAECAAPFLRTGGLLIVSEPPPGPDVAEEARWPAGPLAQLGLVPVALHRGEFGYQVLRQNAPCPDRFPRRVGVPTKRPLY